MVPPSPGAAPQKKPTPVPRRIAGHARRHSSRVNQSLPLTRTMCIVPCRVPSTMRLTSAIAKRPTTTTRKFTPSCSSGMPMVKRGTPLCRSMPIVASASPMNVDIRPLASDRRSAR